MGKPSIFPEDRLSETVGVAVTPAQLIQWRRMSQLDKKTIADRFRAVLSGTGSVGTEQSLGALTPVITQPTVMRTPPPVYQQPENNPMPASADPAVLPDLDVSGWNV